MTLRNRIVLINILCLSIILAIILAFAKSAYLKNYIELENSAIQRNIERLKNAWQDELKQLSTLSSDRAAQPPCIG